MKKMYVLLLLLALLVCAQAAAEAEEKSIRLTFTGDVTLGCEEILRREAYSLVGYAQEHGYDYFFEKVEPLFSADDQTVVNLEGVLSDSAKGENKKKNFRFRGPAEYVNILRAGSVEAVNTANNHTMDYGKAGLEATKAALDAAGVARFGEEDVFIYEKDGIKIAFLGVYYDDFGQKKPRIETQMAQLRDTVNAIVFSFHAGREYAEQHMQAQEEYAQFAIDLGADLVIMHHPHVVQGMDVYQNRSVFYSLGNFCFGGNRHAKVLESLVVGAELRFDADGTYIGQQITLYPAYTTGETTHNNYQPYLVSGEAAENVMRLVQQDTPFELAPFDEEAGCAVQPYLPAESGAGA